MRKKEAESLAIELRAISDSYARIADILIGSFPEKKEEKLPPSELQDGLDDSPGTDEDGDPVEIAKEDKEALDQVRSEQGLLAIQESNKEPDDKPVTLEEVRTALTSLAREGKSTEVREILKKHNALRLSEVAPEDYRAVLEEASELGGSDAR